MAPPAPHRTSVEERDFVRRARVPETRLMSMTRRLLPFMLLVLLAAPASAAGAEELPLRPKGDDAPLGDERLSNETTLTRWAHTNLIGKIRSRPTARSKAVAKLHWNTEDGLPEVYVVL